MRTIIRLAIKLFYFLRLRPVVNSVQRWIVGEHKLPRWPIPEFQAPEEIETYANVRFDWRPDEVSIFGKLIPLDYISDPEVFQYRLDSGSPRDGDCDDYHRWFAEALSKLDDVSKVYMLSVGYEVFSGHTVCVFEHLEKWYLVDYQIRPMPFPTDAPQYIADKYGEGRVVWYLFETLDHRLVEEWNL